MGCMRRGGSVRWWNEVNFKETIQGSKEQKIEGKKEICT